MAFRPFDDSDVQSSPSSHPWNVEDVDASSSDPRITKTGSGWSIISGTPNATLATNLQYITDKTTGDTLTLTFNGTGLWLWVLKSPDSGIVSISLDGTAVNVDLYNASTVRWPLQVADGLNKVDSSGSLISHTCVITIQNQKNSSSSDYRANLDLFNIEVDAGALLTIALVQSIVTAAITSVLGRTDYMPVLEVAPWTVQYQATPATLLDKAYSSGLSDSLGRFIGAPAGTIGTIADVTAAASATQLTTSSTLCNAVLVTALVTNTGTVRAGDSAITTSRGRPLLAGDFVVLGVTDVSKVYVIGNGTDKVAVIYLKV